MNGTIRKSYSPGEKATIALEAMKGDITFNELTKKYGVHSTQLTQWKKQLKDGIVGIFSERKKQVDYEKDHLIEELYKKIGQLEIERDWLKKNLHCLGDKRILVEPDVSLPINRQCELLDLSRSRYYYQPKPIGFEEQNLIHRVDEIYTEHPFFGMRRMAHYLQREGYNIGRKKIRRIYELLGLEAIYPKPKSDYYNKKHDKYPYLLRDVPITNCNQVWSADITYIRLQKGHAYLVAIIDWYSRYVLDWELSVSLEADFCVATLARALKNNSCEIFNTDQGSQFTSSDFVSLLLQRTIKISMDGKGRCLDNIFVERLWRSLKYECIYLLSLVTVKEARQAINKYFGFYNHERPHQALGYETPAEVYFQS